jgi:hypothetical protein
MLRQATIERVQEIIGVLRIMLPGIFAVHDDRHHVLGMTVATLRNLFKVHEIAYGVIGMPWRS